MQERYPDWVVKSPSSPLHFLHNVREQYIADYNDPFLIWTPEKGPSFVPLFMNFEFVYALPVVLFTVYRLARGRGITGPHQLLVLLYGFGTAATCGVAINDVSSWDPKVYSPEQKDVFRYRLFLPHLVFRESRASPHPASPANAMSSVPHLHRYVHAADDKAEPPGCLCGEETAVSFHVGKIHGCQWASESARPAPNLKFGKR